MYTRQVVFDRTQPKSELHTIPPYQKYMHNYGHIQKRRRKKNTVLHMNAVFSKFNSAAE